MTSEKQAKNLNPFEQARLRPDMYGLNGETEIQTREIFDVEMKRIVMKDIPYNNGLFNIARELGSNIIDNKWKSEEKPYPSMKKAKIDVNLEDGSISFWNDGRWIPVVKEEFKFKNLRTKKTSIENLYPSEVYFGDMFSGTNYDDTQKRKTSGRNGVGAKLCNIFSIFFQVEHTDPKAEKKFLQTFTNGGQDRSKPKVTNYKAKTGYTKITYIPDYDYFKYPWGEDLPKGESYGIDQNFLEVMRTYAYEIAMITGLTIYFNGETIKIPSLDKYAKLFYSKSKCVSFTSPIGDECILIEKTEEPEENQVNNIQHMSFVNGIRTNRGGLHVNAWRDAIFGPFVKIFNSRTRKSKVPIKTSAKEAYPYFILFVRSELDNPEFDGNDKEFLVKPKTYRLFNPSSKPQKESWDRMINVSIQTMLKWNFVKLLEEKLLHKVDKLNTKTASSKLDIGSMNGNLRDAKKAGGKEWKKCTLYITEGKSAKTFADAGIGELGTHDYDGAYAIRGKLTNIYELSKTAIRMGEMASKLIQVVGLDNSDHPRYGNIRTLRDADDDGIHIDGLLMAFFYKMSPNLITEGRLWSFSTPVVKVLQKKKKKKPILFYSNLDFKRWYTSAEKNSIEEVKYYKGLGSITPNDAPVYFKNQKVVQITMSDLEKTKQFMDLAFSKTKKCADARKVWISSGMKKAIKFDESESSVTFDGEMEEQEIVFEGKLELCDFIDKHLIIYNRMALERTLPCLWDGFKESQRKIFYGLLTKNYKKPVKLGVASGAVKEISFYHHGDKAMEDAMVKMAQGYPGSNNIPLLVNEGQVGTRQEGGKDCAAGRYLSTKLEDITKAIFPSVDFNLLRHRVEEDIEVEYEYFIPVVPMILVNGSMGIATGWKCEIPCFNIEDIIKKIEIWLKDSDEFRKLEPLKPWYRGFKGEIEVYKNKQSDRYYSKWASKGILNELKSNWFEITELPIGLWTNDFVIFLDYLSGKKQKEDKNRKDRKVKALVEVVNRSTPNTVYFKIKPTNDFKPDINVKGNFNNLVSNKSFSMVVVDELGYPYTFNSAEEILELFCYKRLDFYELRKKYMLKRIEYDLKKSRNKYRFVKAVKDKKLDLYKDDDVLLEEMENWKFSKMSSSSEDDSEGSFDYLLSMQMRSMTLKRLEDLKKERIRLETEFDNLSITSSKDLWRMDLDELKKAYKKFLKTRNEG